MRPILERVGVAEILQGDRVIAAGSYNLVLPDSLVGERAANWAGRATALGTIRLEQGRVAARVIGAPAVRVRLDHREELLVDVYLYVPDASFVAFTCSDASALQQLVAEDAAPRADDRAAPARPPSSATPSSRKR